MKKLSLALMSVLFFVSYPAYAEIIDIPIPTTTIYYEILGAQITPQNKIYFSIKETSPTTNWKTFYFNGNNTIELSPRPIQIQGQNRLLAGEFFCIDERTGSNETSIVLFNGEYKTIIFTGNDSVGYGSILDVNENGYVAFTVGKTIKLYKPDQTVVNLSELKATPSNKKVNVEWKTESEIDNAGFNVWRSEGFKKITPAMIPAKGSSTEGSEYDYLDLDVFNLKPYFYLLEDIDNNGISTFHGPVKAIPRAMYGK